MRVLLEFQLTGVALSHQTRNRARLAEWVAKVRQAATNALPNEWSCLEHEVDVHISEFSEVARRDRDNMAKPILDGMQGVVYVNDRQVRRLHVEWCNIGGLYVVRYMSPVVAQGLSLGEEFLWIRVFSHEARRELNL